MNIWMNVVSSIWPTSTMSILQLLCIQFVRFCGHVTFYIICKCVFCWCIMMQLHTFQSSSLSWGHWRYKLGTIFSISWGKYISDKYRKDIQGSRVNRPHKLRSWWRKLQEWMEECSEMKTELKWNDGRNSILRKLSSSASIPLVRLIFLSFSPPPAPPTTLDLLSLLNWTFQQPDHPLQTII